MNLKITVTTFLIPIFLVATTNIALAAPQAKYIKKNDSAPFNGMLLNDEAAIENKVRFETIGKLHAAEIEKVKALLEAEYKHEIDVLNVRADHQKKSCEAQIDFKDKEIDLLKKNYKSPGFFTTFEGGVIAGVVTTFIVVVGTGYALGQISR